ncbi:MAG: hypothetical protein JG774_919 [Desulfomicrobiaceae bacterium]|jgi:type IV pilus assembly protein PilP|nr:pilus assembly protein PilP [Desulfomicrobiaceae bacterium]MBZ4685174.1 hypothetical protein [Desulfomicrobiaceae bacterium]MDI3492145.1 type pilus assembly protein PilP [Desulfomicrobiaceae bacterium]MDK2872490.1 type pilus assembly protein PilP [Desulfomicrobiaceae bacterium]HCF05883.1 hypothetical protein [Desulfomicrobiaceae bacterium]
MIRCLVVGLLILPGLVWAADPIPEAAGVQDSGNVTENATEVPLPSWIHPRFAPYDPAGRTDPFMSFIQLRAVEQARSAMQRQQEKREPATPLETVDLRTLKLVGVMTPKGGGAVGVVQMPDGKSFIVRPGMGIGLYGGIIKEIRDGALIVEEKTYDILGEEQTQTVTLSLRPSE